MLSNRNNTQWKRCVWIPQSQWGKLGGRVTVMSLTYTSNHQTVKKAISERLSLVERLDRKKRQMCLLSSVTFPTAVSATWRQLWPENITWTIPEINNSGTNEGSVGKAHATEPDILSASPRTYREWGNQLPQVVVWPPHACQGSTHARAHMHACMHRHTHTGGGGDK